MYAKYLIALLIIFLGNCRDPKSQIVEDYLDSTLTRESTIRLQEVFVEKLPPQMPRSVKLKLGAFARRIWDFETYADTLKQTSISPEVMAGMKSTIEFSKTEAGKSYKKSLKNYFDNERQLLSQKRISDFPAARIDFFTQRFFANNESENGERVNRDFNYRMMKIFWILSHPNKPIDEAEIKAKSQIIINAEHDKMQKSIIQGKVPDSMLFRSLVQTMLLTDQEFEAYKSHLNSSEAISLKNFIFDFDHTQSQIRMDKYIQSL